MLFLVLVICLKLVNGIIAIEGESSTVSAHLQPRFATPCITPNGDAAFCIEIHSCQRFIDALQTGETNNFNFIRASRCDPPHENTETPMVCCGKHVDYIRSSTTSLPMTTTPCNSSAPAKPPPKDLFPTTTCGVQKVILANRIVGGRFTSLGEFPWMARLRRRRKDGLLTYACAGFLVAERFVITAAHCVNSTALAPLGPIYQIQLGEHDTERTPDCTFGFGRTCADEPQIIRTAKPIIHPEYSNDINHHNDIAVIPLKQKAKFTEFVHPICLPTELSDVNEMWLAGWGKTDTREKSPVKLKVAIPRADHENCASLYKMVNVNLIHSQFCAGGVAGRDSCSGDSGGPIMVFRDGAWYAEGVVSFGLGCGLDNWPGIYTSIPSHMSWIKKVANRYMNKQNRKRRKTKN